MMVSEIVLFYLFEEGAGPGLGDRIGVSAVSIAVRNQPLIRDGRRF